MVKINFSPRHERSALVAKIVEGMKRLPQPINLLTINTENISFSMESKKYFEKHFKKAGIKSKTYDIWIKSINYEYYLDKTKTKFIEKDDKGTAVIIEDVVGNEYHLNSLKLMLREINPKKKFYIGGIFDPRKNGDFSAYPYKSLSIK